MPKAPKKKLVESLEAEAAKKKLDKAETRRYVGGTITNLRKKGVLKPRPKKSDEEQKEQKARIRQVAKEKKAAAKAQAARVKAMKAVSLSEALKEPRLSGSEKQVKWAHEIRAKWLAKEKGRLEGYRRGSYENQPYFFEERLKQAKEVLGHTSASWWIANRYSF